MDIISLFLTILGIIVAVIFGYLQVVVPFIKGEVKFSRRFPFVESAEAVAATKPRRRKKKKRKRFLIPGLAIGILIIIFVLIRFLIFQAKAIERVPIAVINFTNRTGDEQFDYLCAAIPNLLITNLEQSKHLSIMTWERMHDLLKVLGKEDTPTVDENLGFEICKMDDIHTIVIGSFTKAGNTFVTEAKVLDVQTKKLLKSVSSDGEGVASILKTQIDELSKDIARGVSRYERVIETTKFNIVDVTTTSMDAYNYFLRGRDDYEKFYFDDAKKFLRKAIELDSTFASAYLYLAWTYDMLNDYKESNEILEKAYAFSDLVSEKERLYIMASYAGVIEEEPEKRLRILKQLAKKYPKEKNVYIRISRYYESKELFNKAIEELHKALELDPHYGAALRRTAYLNTTLGDYVKAIEYFKRYAAVSPGDANPFDSMGDLYFRMGKLEDALAQYKEALFARPNFYFSCGKMAYLYALREDYAAAIEWVDHFIAVAQSPSVQMGGYQQKSFYYYLLGNFDRAFANLDTAENLLKPTEFEMGMGLVGMARALIYHDLGKLELSRKYLENCYPKFPKIPANTVLYNYYLGLTLLKQKNLDSAKTTLATIRSILPNVSTWYTDPAQFCYSLLYAELLLAQDSLEKAIVVFEEKPKFEIDIAPAEMIYGVHQPFDRTVGARAFCRMGNFDKAILEYERLTDPDPNKRGRCLIRPTWHYELAKLYEEKGLRTKAIEQYEKFLNIWKNTDENRPEKIDAKKRLAKLMATSL